MFHLAGFVDKLRIDKEVFQKFLLVLQYKYDKRDNPFHNFQHAIAGRLRIILMILSSQWLNTYILNYYIFDLKQSRRRHSSLSMGNSCQNIQTISSSSLFCFLPWDMMYLILGAQTHSKQQRSRNWQSNTTTNRYDNNCR